MITENESVNNNEDIEISEEMNNRGQEIEVDDYSDRVEKESTIINGAVPLIPVKHLRRIRNLDNTVDRVENSFSVVNMDKENPGGYDLSDVLIVGTVDGHLHGIDRTKNKMWSSSTGDYMISAKTNSEPNEEEDQISIIPTTGGGLMYHTNQEGMKKTSVKARMIADSVPFVSNDGVIFTGNKSNRIFKVDLKHGIMNDKLPNKKTLSLKPVHSKVTSNSNELPMSPPLWLGRNDYSLRAVDQNNGLEKFSFSFSELYHLHHDDDNDDAFELVDKQASSSDHTNATSNAFNHTTSTALQPLTVETEDCTQIVSTPDGYVFFTNQYGNILQDVPPINLQSPAMSAFSIKMKNRFDFSANSIDSSPRSNIQYKIRPIKIVHQKIDSIFLDAPSPFPLLPSPGDNLKESLTETIPTSDEHTVMILPAHSLNSIDSHNKDEENGGVYGLELFSGSLSLSDYHKNSLTYHQLNTINSNQDTDFSNESPHHSIEVPENDKLITPLIQPIIQHHNITSPPRSTHNTLLRNEFSLPSKSYTGNLFRPKMKLVHNSFKGAVDQLPAGDVLKVHEMGRGVVKKDHYQLISNDKNDPLEDDLLVHEYIFDDTPLLLQSEVAVEGDLVSQEYDKVLCTYLYREIQKLPLSSSEKQKLFIHNLEFYRSSRLQQQLLQHTSMAPILDGFYSPHHGEKVLAMDRYHLQHHRNRHVLSFIATSLGLTRSTRHQLGVGIDTIVYLEVVILKIILFGMVAIVSCVIIYTFIMQFRKHYHEIKNLFETSKTISRFDQRLYSLGKELLRILIIQDIYNTYELQSNVKITSPEKVQSHSKVDVLMDRIEEVSHEHVGNHVKVGSLILHDDKVLGYGSHGTVVFKGSLNGRPVAVKRMLAQFHKSADREIALLIRSDGHPNVVRYFLKEQKVDFIYLALQMCTMSLRDFVMKLKATIVEEESILRKKHRINKLKKKKDVDGVFIDGGPDNCGVNEKDEEEEVVGNTVIRNGITDGVRESLLQIAQGLTHLHSQRIVHRDIKPHNILCAKINENKDDNSLDGKDSSDEDTICVVHSLDQLGNFTLKISDMGLSKQLDKDEQSFSAFSFSNMSLQFHPSSVALNKNTTDHSLSGTEASHNSSGSNPSMKGETDRQYFNELRTANQKLMNAAPVGTVGWQAPELLMNRHTVIPSKEKKSTIRKTMTQLNIIEDDGGKVDDDEEGGTESGTDDEIEESGEELIVHQEVDTTEENSSSNKKPVSNHWNDIKRPSELSSETSSKQLNKQRKTQNVDVFSLGCVFYYVLSIGEHPFGQWYEREANIVKGIKNLQAIQHLPDAVDLVESMLDSNPTLRPSSSDICYHPFFWTTSKRLEFLIEFSDRLEQSSADAAVVLAVENHAMEIIGIRWDRKLPSSLLEDMGKYRKYDTNSVRDLLRVIRNKRHHYHELSPQIKSEIGNIPTGFYNYFDKKFPLLLLHCYHVAMKYLVHEKSFVGYFKPMTSCYDEGMKKNKSIKHNEEALNQNENVDPGQGPTSVVTLATDMDANHEGKLQCMEGFDEIIVWHGSAVGASIQAHGWWRESNDWIDNANNVTGISLKKGTRPSHLIKSASDLKYRTRLCTHWELTNGSACPMRKKGKCIFAHGPLELRVKETRRDKWGKDKLSMNGVGPDLWRVSGGEDVLGAARSIEKIRANDNNEADLTFSSPTYPRYPMYEAPYPNHSQGMYANGMTAMYSSMYMMNSNGQGVMNRGNGYPFEYLPNNGIHYGNPIRSSDSSSPPPLSIPLNSNSVPTNNPINSNDFVPSTTTQSNGHRNNNNVNRDSSSINTPKKNKSNGLRK